MPFRDVVGHRALLPLLSRAVQRGTLPPSLLFVGPDGVGKLRVALAVAQAQNCLSPHTSTDFDRDACGECESCRKISRGSFSDVVLVAPGENGSITIEQVRQVVREAAYRPFEGRRRVVMIDDADRLLTGAQNALLKTLEEPPAASQFVLVTTRPDVLLPTVRSRTQRLGFGHLAVDEVETVLSRQGITGHDARAAAAAAGGSVGRAMALASGELVEARDAAIALLRALSSARDARQRLDAAKALVGKGRTGVALRQELTRRLQALTSLLRDVELLAARPDTAGLANTDVADGLATVSRTFGAGRGLIAYAAVGRALDAIERNVGPKVVADWLVCEL